MKSMGLILEETKNELIEYVNKVMKEKGLSVYLMEIPFKEVHEELIKVKNQEIQQEKSQVLVETETNDIIEKEGE